MDTQKCERDATHEAVGNALAGQWMTVDRLRRIVKEADGDYVKVTVRRVTPVRRGRQIHMILFQGDNRRAGPKSVVDRQVTDEGSGLWSAWWFVPDLERWLRKFERESRRG